MSGTIVYFSQPLNYSHDHYYHHVDYKSD